MPILIPDHPLDTPFTLFDNRPEVTEEDDERFLTELVSWDGRAQHGGGHIPEDYAWTSNPKERQDELMGEWPQER
ncbi:hypothetical protein LY474_15550 [Myxococcus stipitatus]|uniref:hypothetical protein n=1 Tax=Myxococcus stipitatus TaxID=83455 RepID=UPI001F2FE6DE|nr:hypothetical protein [Myxococcus stipitatus]MCE9669226.1 hypothetical protein [Myxococcus stipitatus]